MVPNQRAKPLSQKRISRKRTWLQVAAHEGWGQAATVDALIRKAGYAGRSTDALRQSLSVTRYQARHTAVPFLPSPLAPQHSRVSAALPFRPTLTARRQHKRADTEPLPAPSCYVTTAVHRKPEAVGKWHHGRLWFSWREDSKLQALNSIMRFASDIG